MRSNSACRRGVRRHDGRHACSSLKAPRPRRRPPPPPAPADVQVLLADVDRPLWWAQVPFDKVKVVAFKPALEEAMRLNLAEVDAIADNPAPPSFRQHHRGAGAVAASR